MSFVTCISVWVSLGTNSRKLLISGGEKSFNSRVLPGFVEVLVNIKKVHRLGVKEHTRVQRSLVWWRRILSTPKVLIFPGALHIKLNTKWTRHELHDRWDALMVRMLRLFSKLNIRVTEDSCGLDDRAEIVKLLYHHAWVETNLKKIEPMRDNLYHNERVHLDNMEPDVIAHEESAVPLVTNVSPYFWYKCIQYYEINRWYIIVIVHPELNSWFLNNCF